MYLRKIKHNLFFFFDSIIIFSINTCIDMMFYLWILVNQQTDRLHMARVERKCVFPLVRTKFVSSLLIVDFPRLWKHIGRIFESIQQTDLLKYYFLFIYIHFCQNSKWNNASWRCMSNIYIHDNWKWWIINDIF